ncbi:MAG: peptidylprolyl isomerase [Pseudomonadota bacterium]|nr:peptidylprolyl isomerase [Pseudomonadota bacterium]
MIAFSTTEANADHPQVILTTSVGTMIATLDEERAPHTVANFLELVEAEFYDGLIFHRVIAGFVIQTGGYDVHMERREGPRNIPNESFNGLMNRKGTLSMARLADPDSANSQFFINLEANTHLDALPGKPGYAVFGHLVTGTDVAEIIEFAETGIRQGMAGVPLEPILILSARRRREESRPGAVRSPRLLRDL